MIFNMVGPMGKKPYLPLFTGKAKVTFLGDGSAGYMEFYTSGTLTWLNDKAPPSVDLFCVGGGAGGANPTSAYGNAICGGGGSGYTKTVLDASLPASIEILIGAGGAANAAGGQTSIGELCVANGGTPASRTGGKGGDGGSGGGDGHSNIELSFPGGNGGTNGSDGTRYGGTGTGKGQGTPTTDLLGRVHAGGGAGSGSSKHTTVPQGGTSDFIEGSGQAGYKNSGGGGYGGGGGGNFSPTGAPGAGGQGFAMIAWGDYSSAIVS